MTPPAGPHLHAKGSDHRLTRKPESHHPQPRPTRTPLLLCPGGAVHGLSIRAAKTGESKDHITRRPGTVLIDQLAPQGFKLLVADMHGRSVAHRTDVAERSFSGSIVAENSANPPGPMRDQQAVASVRRLPIFEGGAARNGRGSCGCPQTKLGTDMIAGGPSTLMLSCVPTLPAIARKLQVKAASRTGLFHRAGSRDLRWSRTTARRPL